MATRRPPHEHSWVSTCSKVNPNYPPAVVNQACLLVDAKKNDEAAAILRKAIDDAKEKSPADFYLCCSRGSRTSCGGPMPPDRAQQHAVRDRTGTRGAARPRSTW